MPLFLLLLFFSQEFHESGIRILGRTDSSVLVQVDRSPRFDDVLSGVTTPFKPCLTWAQGFLCSGFVWRGSLDTVFLSDSAEHLALSQSQDVSRFMPLYQLLVASRNYVDVETESFLECSSRKHLVDLLGQPSSSKTNGPAFAFDNSRVSVTESWLQFRIRSDGMLDTRSVSAIISRSEEGSTIDIIVVHEGVLSPKRAVRRARR